MSYSVGEQTETVQDMVEAAAKGRALMGGTTAMRLAAKTYLPMFEKESAAGYKSRLAASWLFNGYRKTVKDMTGRVFDVPVELASEAPQQLHDWAMDIDLEGRDLSVFARSVFEDAMSGAGISFIFVDAPQRQDRVTRRQAEALRLRPYMVHVRLEDVLGWRCELIGNVQTLTQFRMMERICEPDPNDEFKDVWVDQVRVLDRLDTGRVQTRLYRRQENDREWQLVDEPRLSDIDRITVTPVYLNRTGFFTAEPLLDDLADVNIAHWQSQSDQRHILHVARVPILHHAGRTEEEGEITIGANVAVGSLDPAARLEWVEHSGAAIGAGRQDLKDLEFQMETHGLQLLVARPGAQSATGEVLDAEKETSTLAMTADQLKDALERALQDMADYGGLGDVDVSVSVNKEFTSAPLSAQEMQVLLQSVVSGNISRETYIRELARRGMIAPETDPEDEAERIETEGGDLVVEDAG